MCKQRRKIQLVPKDEVRSTSNAHYLAVYGSDSFTALVVAQGDSGARCAVAYMEVRRQWLPVCRVTEDPALFRKPSTRNEPCPRKGAPEPPSGRDHLSQENPTKVWAPKARSMSGLRARETEPRALL